jgi:hypothetical protein
MSSLIRLSDVLSVSCDHSVLSSVRVKQVTFGNAPMMIVAITQAVLAIIVRSNYETMCDV